MDSESEIAATAAAHAADIEYLVRKNMTSGYQLFSLLTPPIYLAFSLSRYGRSSFSVNRLLRATWIGGAAGIAAAGAFGYVRYGFSSPEHVQKQRIRVTYDTSRLRAEDHSVIGSLLCGVLVPAIFWKRAHIANMVLGGAGIGSSIGLVWHYTRVWTGDVPPKPDLHG
ncbi:hypothetical protein CPB85DRAFT_1524414 [Mucidula mucida]|nr:hypothetical protein CPB85DRAFT_1524414 [Mucidula mucida]